MSDEQQRRPIGRPTRYPGKGKPRTFTLPEDATKFLADDATAARVSQSDFITALIIRHHEDVRKFFTELTHVESHPDVVGGSMVPPDGRP